MGLTLVVCTMVQPHMLCNFEAWLSCRCRGGGLPAFFGCLLQAGRPFLRQVLQSTSAGCLTSTAAVSLEQPHACRHFMCLPITFLASVHSLPQQTLILTVICCCAAGWAASHRGVLQLASQLCHRSSTGQWLGSCKTCQTALTDTISQIRYGLEAQPESAAFSHHANEHYKFKCSRQCSVRLQCFRSRRTWHLKMYPRS